MRKMRKNIEDKLQAEIVLWFGQTWPQYQQLFFEVYNNTTNIRHAMHRRSMGMRTGVADMPLIQPNTGILCGIEFKAPGSTYSYSEIEHQINWGKSLIENGGYYIMSSDKILIKSFIEAIIINDIVAIELFQKVATTYIEDQLLTRKTIQF